MYVFRILTLVLFFSFAGCATQEYREAANECSYEAYQRYPVNNVMQTVSMPRNVQVPTGQTNCMTDYIGNTATTRCQQVMRTEVRYIQQNIVVDSNESMRSNAIKECAAAKCYSRFGNSDCTTGKMQYKKSDYTKEENCKAQSEMLFSSHQTKEREQVFDRCMSKQ